MSRRPLPKIKLTDDEYNLVCKIVRKSRMDDWCFIDRVRTDYDMVLDLNYGKHITLAYGLRIVDQGLSDGWENENLTEDENMLWKGIKSRLEIRD